MDTETKDDGNAVVSEPIRYRRLPRFWQAVFLALTLAATFLAVNQIFGLRLFVGVVILDSRYYYLLLGLLLSLVFIVFPPHRKRPSENVPWYDVLLFLATLAISAYLAWNAQEIVESAWEFVAPEDAVYIALALWVLLLEGARRAGGLAIFAVAGIVSIYPLFADRVPDVIAGNAMSLLELAPYHIYSAESVLGIPMRAFGQLVFGFMIFGVALQMTGGGKFFIDLAFALLGHVRGGPAKVAIFSSGLMGSVSGSVITNVLTTGVLSIPAMKRTGFPARYAAGVEACASTGGVLMPPVMGATAFVMASFLGIPYIEIAIAAVIPSALYYFGLFMQIDAYAARNGLHGMDQKELPRLREVIKDGWYYIFVFVLLIWMLAWLKREAQAPFYATLLLLVINQFSPTHRLTWGRFLDFLNGSGRLLVELIGILGPIGLIVGALVASGMAGTFANDLVFIAGGAPILLLIMGALTSFILGIGMTVTAAYIFLAVILAPALTKVGMDPLAVHLFILYWGMLSFITPPVAIGAFAAASIAGANAMRAGLEAMRLGSIIYFIPFLFVFHTGLIMQGDPGTVAILTASAALGTLLLAAGLQGYLVFVGRLGGSPVDLAVRGALVVGGLCLALPGGDFLPASKLEFTLAAALLCGPAIAIARWRRRAVTAA